jgi:glycosyltransferase involved in cell wall biosynthesis
MSPREIAALPERPRVLVLHNRYRAAGGEERALELHLAALQRLGLEHRVLLRASEAAGRVRAAAGLLRGGEAPGEVARAVRELGADVVHVHNMHPLFGPRALAAARREGARVIAHLHNFRLFCAIGVAFRDGAPCFRCRGRLTLPGVALTCRGSVPESAVYGAALAAHGPAIIDAVDRFVAPSGFAVGQLVRLGVPAARIETLPHYVPEKEIARGSTAGEGRYALAVGRMTPEKGLDTAIEAAALAGVPLRIVGDGPLAAELRGLAARLGAPVEFLGRVPTTEMGELLAGAALAVVPSRGSETFSFAAAEAAAAGLPVVAAHSGALPEVVGPERCVARGDVPALAAAMARLWRDPAERKAEGERLIDRVRGRFGRERFSSSVLALYRAVLTPSPATSQLW